ncbi:uncharacterized protein DUF3467 [Scopulibacillus darangshiensis]|uniref:Uncharacterized protein DUF3467 n=1 Tax=Scopulibacillus darangshiensis TaxID=442528 RepID=A0A4R2NN53_9BACL|nr:DUF3467 domain-containing protein [Scopulibacillus darangshiensis]TCP22694.1 uncharacterized protein DUF3467 [Scopulibacillus darangshiensis]
MFSDHVQLESSAEHAVLNFIQMVPGAPEGQPNGKIISRIALTWPHVARLAGLLDSTIDRQKREILNNLEQNLFVKEHKENDL